MQCLPESLDVPFFSEWLERRIEHIGHDFRHRCSSTSKRQSRCASVHSVYLYSIQKQLMIMKFSKHTKIESLGIILRDFCKVWHARNDIFCSSKYINLPTCDPKEFLPYFFLKSWTEWGRMLPSALEYSWGDNANWVYK